MIIIRNDSSTQAIAMPSVPRATVLASWLIGDARLNANDHEHDADQHGGGNVEQRLDVPVDVEPLHQPVQQPRQIRPTLSTRVSAADDVQV